jgi:hypothetical protein
VSHPADGDDVPDDYDPLLIDYDPLLALFGDSPKTRIIAALLKADSPMNPTEIVRNAGLNSRTTFYNHRDDLVELGVIGEVEHVGNMTRYGLFPGDGDDRGKLLAKMWGQTAAEYRDVLTDE